MKARTSCNLGSLNLYAFVRDKFTDYASFDFDKFRQAVIISSNALDDIIDENAERLPEELSEYKQNANDWRNIGLGVFGYAYMLMALGLKYGSEEALEFTDKLFEDMMATAIRANIDRGITRGSYPKFDPSLITKSAIFRNHYDGIDISKEFGFRNCSLLSIAPTGSLSTMLIGGAGGVEPEFALSYTRRTDNLKESYTIESQIVRDYREVTGNKGELPDYFVCSADIDWRDRVKTQGVIQRHIDTAISSTVNLPKETTVAEIEKLYLEAWKEGLKGITIFRDGCKRLGILTTEDSEDNETPITPTNGFSRGDIISVDDDLVGTKTKLTSGCGETTLQAFYDDLTGDPLETYISMGDGAGCERNLEAISRLISLCLRAGVHISAVTKQLKKVRPCMAYCNRQKTKGDCSEGTSCPDSIGRALDRLTAKMQDRWFDDSTLWVEEETPSPEASQAVETTEVDNGMICPECGSKLMMEGGCVICRGDDTHSGCGWSRCG